MKIVGMLPVYNDEDIIEEVIKNMISNGIELVILDNGSNDHSYTCCESFLGKGVLELYRFEADTYMRELVLRMLYDMAIKLSPDWMIQVDSDEILESGIQNKTLKDAIEQVDSNGYNLIQFDRFDFFMTDDDDESAKTIKDKMKYYSYQGDYVYRSWKYMPGISIGDVSGHYPIFPNGEGYKISPKKFVMRHYPLRTEEQSKRKVNDRIRGTTVKSKDGRALNYHYQKMLHQDFSKKFDHNLFHKYNEDGKWNYKIKISPFANENPPKKMDLFTEEGCLREKPKSNLEYRLLLHQEKNKFLSRNIRKLKNITKMKSK